MSTDKITLARDADDFGDKPPEVSNVDWELFKSRRRAERSQVDVDEQRITAMERAQWISKEFDQGRGD